MNFNSVIFLIFFLPVFYLLFFLCPKKKRYIIVLISSLIFYLYSGLFNFILLISVSFINYIITIFITKSKTKNNLFTIILVCLNILTLLFFKYGNSMIFPLGISFYTFNNISYIVDVYRKKITCETNYFYYLTYIMLFCHVTMGPITNYDVIKKELHNLGSSTDDFIQGYKRFLRGLFKKVLVADNLGLLYINLMNLNEKCILLNVLCLIIYALQLYIDFSSYSDMAIGLGKTIGIAYPENFDYPYLATSISDFWRKWHMTLTNFFKEYIYFPMGGNRVPKSRHIFNILTVWFLTGMWHGNTLNFLFWGLYYGVILICEKYFLKKILDKLPSALRHIYVLLIVLIGYIFFSINDFGEMLVFIKGLFNGPIFNKSVLFYIKENLFLLVISIILCFRMPDKIKRIIQDNIVVLSLNNIMYVLFYILTLAYILSGTYLPFLYNSF